MPKLAWVGDSVTNVRLKSSHPKLSKVDPTEANSVLLKH